MNYWRGWFMHLTAWVIFLSFSMDNQDNIVNVHEKQLIEYHLNP